MNILRNILAGTVPLLATGAVRAQSGHMSDGGMWGAGWMGGYGGFWVPILVVAVVAGLVVWVVKQKGK